VHAHAHSNEYEDGNEYKDGNEYEDAHAHGKEKMKWLPFVQTWSTESRHKTRSKPHA
jgi:hypothetical protein